MKRIITFFLLFFTVGVLFAQEVTFQAISKNTVGEGDKFYLSYKLNQKGSNFKIPDMGKFRILSGPKQSTSSSTQIINGSVTSEYTFSYTYVVLAPQEKGAYTIPPATISVKGKEYKSNALKIKVVEASQAQQANRNQRQQNQRQRNSQPTTTNSASGSFVRFNVNKKSAYQGEPIYGTFKIYLTSQNLAGFQDLKFPDYNGFWVEEFNEDKQIRLNVENVNGRRYFTSDLKSVVLFPQRSGKLTVSEGNFNTVIQERVQGGNSNSLFDSYFGRYENIPYDLKSNKVNIDVKSLPSGQPKGFTGAVGDFKCNVTYSTDSIDVNEAFTMTVKISGTGNLNLLHAPEIDFPSEFEVYDPEVKRNYSLSAQGMKGSISWVYTIIPRYPELYKMDEVNIAWFNPKAGVYKSYMADEHTIYVNRTADFVDEGPRSREFSNSEIDMIGSDIRYIKSVPNAKDYSLIDNTLFWLIYLIPSLLLLSLILLRRKQIKQRANVAHIRDRKANKIAMQRLKVAKKMMDGNDKEFYNEVIKAVWGYIADKLDMDTASLSREAVTERLEARGLSEDLIKKLMNIIDTCEYAHFAPSSSDNDPSRVYQFSIALISKLEQNL